MLTPGNVNVASKSGFTALHYAAWNARVDAVKWLMDKGASLTQNEKGDSPLHLAAMNKNPRSGEVVEMILSRNPDCWKIKNSKGELAIGLANQHNNGDVVRAILQSVRRFRTAVNVYDILTNKHATLLHYAAGHGTEEDIDWLLKVLDRHTSVNDVVDESSMTPLHWAALEGNTITLKALANGGAKLTQVSRKSVHETPLFLALGRGHIDFAEELLKCEKDLSNKNTKERRLTTNEWMEGVENWLMIYYKEQVDHHVKHELERGFKEHTSRQSATWLTASKGSEMVLFKEVPPLYLALHAGRLDIAKFFQRLSSDEDAVNKKGIYTGRTPLHWAVLLRKRDIVEQLCSKVTEFAERVKVCEQDGQGIAPVQYAMEMNLQGIEAELLRNESVISWLHRDRQIYVDSTNAILVCAALIASVTFAGWLQPPLGYVEYPNVKMSYAAIRQKKGVHVFWVFNSLSFFAAIGAVQAGVYGVLPALHDAHIVRSVIFIRQALQMASLLMTVSVMCVLGAFGAAGFVVLPPVLRYDTYMLITITFGGIINTALILRIMRRVLVTRQHFRVWKRIFSMPVNHDDGNSYTSVPPDLVCDKVTPSPPPSAQWHSMRTIFPWEDGIEELYAPNNHGHKLSTLRLSRP